MSFADKLIQLRKQKGWSQEELAEQMNVTRQSVSKWESEQSVPDIERIIQLADLFDVSTDYLLRDTNDKSVYKDENEEQNRRVAAAEAERFIALKKKVSTPLAVGVFLCIISPICLLLLGALTEAKPSLISENAAGGFGIIALFAFIAAAVILFVINGSKTSEFEFMEKEVISVDSVLLKMIRDEKADYKRQFTTYCTIGTALCVLSTIPLFGVWAFSADDEEDVLLLVTGLCATIFIIAVGVAFFVKAGTIQSAYNMLLQVGDYSKDKKRKSAAVSAITVSYWLLATAIFLLWSFLTNKWNITWLVWAVAGVLYPAVISIVNLIYKRK